MLLDPANDQVAHHAANAAAVAVPVAAVAYHLPDYLVYSTAIAGLIWYIMLISEKLSRWYRKWQGDHDGASSSTD